MTAVPTSDEAPVRDRSADGAAAYRPASAHSVTVFTTPWCGYCRSLKRNLDSLGVSYREVNIEDEPEAALLVSRVNGGNQTVPTVLFADGTTLTNPPASEVARRIGVAVGS
ncbi:MAG: mycoredoxin [Acidothermus sp.]|nr:mycoredoxin [Acidothermus sp.]MCL6537060.1 mycoredoxin [Acidothermus sp.]